MLDAGIKAQLQNHLGHIKQPLEIIASLDGSETSKEMLALLQEIASLSEHIRLRTDGTAGRRPSFALKRQGTDMKLQFAGLPMGHEFSSLVLALLQTGGHPCKLDGQTIARIQDLKGHFEFESWFSQSCQNCPDVVQALNLLAILNPDIQHTAIDGALFADEAERRQILTIPSVWLNGEPFAQGRMDVADILRKIDGKDSAREAQDISAKAPFDLLVLGAGPAGAAAAIYAARKGIRTGLVAERFGGQVQDTLSIENFIATVHTEGSQLSRALEQHVQVHEEVDIIRAQRGKKLLPAGGSDGLHEIELENGAKLKSKTLIIATGARWREMGIPGEQHYKTRGVCFCPHCDGPLFKGKRVAVIGGGNSGVEAAIDLAGITAQVTLIEFDSTLRADEVLQRKLKSLANVQVITHAQTTEVLGDGSKVTGLRYQPRDGGKLETLELEGIFVQIGLLPNTDWLKDTLSMSRGEILVDARGQTSIPGIFAAGDCTNVPYKQIIIAAGEGAKAALSAFDHLIRTR